MANCVRGGVSYKRHKVVNRMCARCGAIEVSDEKRQELIDDAVKQLDAAEFRAMVKVLAEDNHIG